MHSPQAILKALIVMDTFHEQNKIDCEQHFHASRTEFISTGITVHGMYSFNHQFHNVLIIRFLLLFAIFYILSILIATVW